MTTVQAPEPGSMGTSHNKSVTFNNPSQSVDEKLKELEKQKQEMENKLKDATSKKDLSISAA